MILNQWNFPHTYRADEKTMQADHDRCFQLDAENARAACTRHMGTGEMHIGTFAREADPRMVLAFLIDILKADPEVNWTGWRVLCTVNRSNGFPVFGLELFAKAPDSDTVVYSGQKAPNVNQLASALVQFIHATDPDASYIRSRNKNEPFYKDVPQRRRGKR